MSSVKFTITIREEVSDGETLYVGRVEEHAHISVVADNYLDTLSGIYDDLRYIHLGVESNF